MKTANHFAEDVEEQTLIFHLYEIDSLDLIYSPRENIDQSQTYGHSDVELDVAYQVIANIIFHVIGTYPRINQAIEV
jgi:hypothetical protein